MAVNPKVAIHTLGCKLNQAESELIARRFAKVGYVSASEARADICILNTCTVTHIADRKSRHLVRLLRKRNPRALIVATGCYAEKTPTALTEVGADIVVGNEDKLRLVELIRGRDVFLPGYPEGQQAADGARRIRSFIKIQDGCNGVCAYCVVPQVRRREYCVPAVEIIGEIKARVADGYKEVVLTGTKIGTYNHEGIDLVQLLGRILTETAVERLHLSSLQPQEVSIELLSMWQDARLCRHFHLALQSGSDAVLKRMRRCYNIGDYQKAVSLIRHVVPGVAITTDVMVGFPGESTGEFEECYDFCRKLGFADIHVFTYSPRPGTLAAAMPGQVSDRLKKQRMRKMLGLAQQSAAEFGGRLLGQTAMVLWENVVSPGSGVYSGLAENYVRVFTRSHETLTNRLVPAKMLGLYKDGLWGEVTV